MIQPNDILIRETSDGQTVWVSQRMVVEGCGIKEKDLKDTCRVRYKKSLDLRRYFFVRTQAGVSRSLLGFFVAL